MIKPSKTAMVIYDLTCPNCGENDVTVHTSDPEQLWCNSCEEEIDLQRVTDIVSSWQVFLADLAAYKANLPEVKACKEESETEAERA